MKDDGVIRVVQSNSVFGAVIGELTLADAKSGHRKVETKPYVITEPLE